MIKEIENLFYDFRRKKKKKRQRKLENYTLTLYSFGSV